MAVEKPLNIEEFFLSRQEIASRHESKSELNTMARVREHLVEVQTKEAEKPSVAESTKKK